MYRGEDYDKVDIFFWGFIIIILIAIIYAKIYITKKKPSEKFINVNNTIADGL
jgi:uncharacterized membrane protein